VVSQRIEEVFGWMKAAAGLLRRRARVDAALHLGVAAPP
jgi:hypothetical protein